MIEPPPPFTIRIAVLLFSAFAVFSVATRFVAVPSFNVIVRLLKVPTVKLPSAFKVIPSPSVVRESVTALAVVVVTEPASVMIAVPVVVRLLDTVPSRVIATPVDELPLNRTPVDVVSLKVRLPLLLVNTVPLAFVVDKLTLLNVKSTLDVLLMALLPKVMV
nr:hypothetical protein [Streptococcus hyointestinalis]